MKDQNCGYCMGGELLDAFVIYICDLSVSTLILFKERSHPRCCIVAYELVDISEEDRNAFFSDVVRVAKAIHKVFQSSKVNYGAYGDGGCHLHFHLVPKYEDQFECENSPRLTEKSLAHPAFSAVNTGSKRGTLQECVRSCKLIFPRKILEKVLKTAPFYDNLFLAKERGTLQERTHSCKNAPFTETWPFRKSPPGSGR